MEGEVGLASSVLMNTHFKHVIKYTSLIMLLGHHGYLLSIKCGDQY